MSGTTNGYPFIFQMKAQSDSDDILECTLQYRFKSEKSHHTYIVRVEQYIEHSYCLKFFDKANRLSNNKFSLRTGTFEPRTIFYTLFNIMLDVMKRDPQASFFFIGANDEKDEQGGTTRRFRIYSTFVSSIISENVFEHHRNNALSLYILVNKNSVKDIDAYTERLTNYVWKEFR